MTEERGGGEIRRMRQILGELPGIRGRVRRHTSDKEIIAKLSELIARNKATPKYIAARRDLEASRAEEHARRIEEWKNRIKLSEAINGR